MSELALVFPVLWTAGMVFLGAQWVKDPQMRDPIRGAWARRTGWLTTLSLSMAGWIVYLLLLIRSLIVPAS